MTIKISLAPPISNAEESQTSRPSFTKEATKLIVFELKTSLVDFQFKL